MKTPFGYLLTQATIFPLSSISFYQKRSPKQGLTIFLFILEEGFTASSILMLNCAHAKEVLKRLFLKRHLYIFTILYLVETIKIISGNKALFPEITMLALSLTLRS